MRYVLMFLIIVSIIWGGPILVETTICCYINIFVNLLKLKLITLYGIVAEICKNIKI